MCAPQAPQSMAGGPDSFPNICTKYLYRFCQEMSVKCEHVHKCINIFGKDVKLLLSLQYAGNIVYDSANIFNVCSIQIFIFLTRKKEKRWKLFSLVILILVTYNIKQT